MPELSGPFVVLMGMGTVFVGLICIIVLVVVMGKIIGAIAKDTPAPAAAPAAPSPAIAEDLGTDISKIQIHSIKRI